MQRLLGKLLTYRCFHHPVFVVGASRSGTSVLLQALGRHPAILSMQGEAPFVTSIGGAVHLFEFSESRDYYQQSLKFPKEYLYQSLRKLCFEYAAGRNYGLKMIIKGLVGRDLSYLKKQYWCAKTFPDHEVAQGMVELYPNVRFVHTVRNGYDVVQSRTKFSGFRDQEFEAQCQAWVQSVTNFSYLRKFTSAFEVRHEQLVFETTKVFEDLSRFLDIPYDEGPVNYLRNTMVHPLGKPTQGSIDVKKVFDRRKPAWERWTPMQRESFKRICAKTMDELGYQVPF